MLFSPLEQFDAITIVQLEHFYPFITCLFMYDFSLLSIMVPFIIILCLIAFGINFFEVDFKLVPDFWQFFFEFFFKFVLDILVQQAGSHSLVYFPFVFSIFIFILFCNLLSLVPYGIALTSHISLVFFMSFTLWLSVFFIGLLKHNLDFLKIFVPEAPFFVLLLLIPIEMASYAIRALSLALRLSANIMAGHILVYIIASFVLHMSSLKFCFIFLAIVLLAILVLELGVAFVQAYVFTVLFCIYLNDSLKAPGH